jgi:hypothetical protein
MDKDSKFGGGMKNPLVGIVGKPLPVIGGKMMGAQNDGMEWDDVNRRESEIKA